MDVLVKAITLDSKVVAEFLTFIHWFLPVLTSTYPDMPQGICSLQTNQKAAQS
jgi:hypothetical protein